MIGIAAQTERRRYLHRTTDPADRRAKIIAFASQGCSLALSAPADLEAEIAGRLGEPAVRQVRRTLLQIIDGPARPRRGGPSRPPA
jgi:hypothetical protein